MTPSVSVPTEFNCEIKYFGKNYYEVHALTKLK